MAGSVFWGPFCSPGHLAGTVLRLCFRSSGHRASLAFGPSSQCGPSESHRIFTLGDAGLAGLGLGLWCAGFCEPRGLPWQGIRALLWPSPGSRGPGSGPSPPGPLRLPRPLAHQGPSAAPAQSSQSPAVAEPVTTGPRPCTVMWPLGALHSVPTSLHRLPSGSPRWPWESAVGHHVTRPAALRPTSPQPQNLPSVPKSALSLQQQSREVRQLRLARNNLQPCLCGRPPAPLCSRRHLAAVWL